MPLVRQTAVWLDEETEQLLTDFKERYPRAKYKDITIAALKTYFKRAKEYGVDGNLIPLMDVQAPRNLAIPFTNNN